MKVLRNHIDSIKIIPCDVHFAQLCSEIMTGHMIWVQTEISTRRTSYAEAEGQQSGKQGKLKCLLTYNWISTYI